MHQPIKLLIFDLDGTLVDTQDDLASSVNFALRSLSLPELEVAGVMRLVGDGMRKLLQRALPRSRQNDIDDAIALFRQHYAENLLVATRFYPGALEVLDHFSARGLAVISNKPEAFTRTILEGLVVAERFGAILGGDSLPTLKPSPEPILHVMSQLGVQPEQTLMIGDSPSDIVAGKAAGAFTCAVTYGYRAEALLSDAEPDLMIDRLVELISLLQ